MKISEKFNHENNPVNLQKPVSQVHVVFASVDSLHCGARFSQSAVSDIFYFSAPSPLVLPEKRNIEADTVKNHFFSFTHLKTERSAQKSRYKCKKHLRDGQWNFFRFNTNLLFSLPSPLAQDEDGQASPRCRLCHWR